MDDTLTLPTVSVSVSKKEAVKQMLNVKDERKRAEYDVQLLANRLAYLRAEERAASKRLQDTKKRTEAVRRAKEREANKDSTKAAHAHQLAMKEKRQQKQVQAKRRESQANLEAARKVRRLGVRGGLPRRLPLRELPVNLITTTITLTTTTTTTTMTTITTARQPKILDLQRALKNKFASATQARQEKQLGSAILNDYLTTEMKRRSASAKSVKDRHSTQVGPTYCTSCTLLRVSNVNVMIRTLART